MNIIVTGGAGFIGCNFVYYELEKHPEDRIICLDKLTYAGNLKSLDEAMKSPSFRFVRGDICDREVSENQYPGYADASGCLQEVWDRKISSGVHR